MDISASSSPVLKDLPLLWKVYDHIEAHPEEWRQGTWAHQAPDCGTVFCFAGHVAITAHPGAVIRWEKCSDSLNYADRVSVNGVTHCIQHVAQDALGLDSDEANALFDGSNSLQDIHDLIIEWEHAEIDSMVAV